MWCFSGNARARILMHDSYVVFFYSARSIDSVNFFKKRQNQLADKTIFLSTVISIIDVNVNAHQAYQREARA